ncbi:MAG: hypothetical protein KDD64_01890 [Bdellovibrionales bacterium]|nr:hypothetical protein [Bdellovibrionales bacterium]
MTEKERTNFYSGLASEPLRGFARAVRVQDNLFISGTTAVNEKGDVVGIGDPYLQTKFVIQNVRNILREAEFRMQDVVRTRLFVTDLTNWKFFARAHREAFEKIRPASSIVQVQRLSDVRFLVEMEVDAIRGCSEAQFIDFHVSDELNKE